MSEGRSQTWMEHGGRGEEIRIFLSCPRTKAVITDLEVYY